MVHVGKNRSLEINSQSVGWDELAEKLRRTFAGSPGSAVFVSGTRELPFADVAEVLDTIRGAGFSRVALMPREQR